MEIEILYAVKSPFMDGWLYVTDDNGIVYDFTYEEAKERAERWKGKVVQVTFEEVD